MPEIVSSIIELYPFRRIGGRPEFLLLKRSSDCLLGGFWQSALGKIEPGETAWQAALRELREETGLSPVQDAEGWAHFWQIDYVNTFYEASFDRVQMCPCFTAEVSPDAPVILSPEHTDFRWEPLEVARSILPWPGQRRAFDELVSEILTPSLVEPFCRIRM